MLIRVTFDTRASSANDGKIVLFFDDEDGIALSNWVGKAIVISPTGVVLRDYAAGTVTFGPGGDGTILVPIPKDGSGAYLRGDYTITVFLDNLTVGPTPDIELLHIYNYCPHNSPDHTTSDLIVLKSEADCVTKLLTATDISDYTDVTMTSRLITITPPSIANVAPSTTAGSNLTAALTYTKVTYGTELSVVFQYALENPINLVTFVTQGSAEIYKEVFVDCLYNMCALVKCLAQRFMVLRERALKLGGWYNLSPQERGDYDYVAAMVNLAHMQMSCNDATAAKVLFDEAKNILNCNCGCSDDSNVPQPL